MSQLKDNLEYQVREWKSRYSRVCNVLNEVKEERNKLRNSLETAEYKIISELEPRIKREDRSYDSWVLSGGSDVCMQNGMNGNCGLNCELFGTKEECIEGMPDDEILNCYRNGEIDEAAIGFRNLEIKASIIDCSERMKVIWKQTKLLFCELNSLFCHLMDKIKHSWRKQNETENKA